MCDSARGAQVTAIPFDIVHLLESIRLYSFKPPIDKFIVAIYDYLNRENLPHYA